MIWGNVEFILDFKAGITWIISFMMITINEFETFDQFSHIVIDILTIVSLVIAIGYTINRWYRYRRKFKQ